MTYEQFKEQLLQEIEDATKDRYNEKNVLDLRVERKPYDTWKDNDIFCISDIEDAWEFVKDAEEWYVDIYENYVGENYAEYTGYSVASWG